MSASPILKVAIVQPARVFFNLKASLARAVEFIGQATEHGAKLVVFGETSARLLRRRLSDI